VSAFSVTLLCLTKYLLSEQKKELSLADNFFFIFRLITETIYLHRDTDFLFLKKRCDKPFSLPHLILFYVNQGALWTNLKTV